VNRLPHPTPVLALALLLLAGCVVDDWSGEDPDDELVPADDDDSAGDDDSDGDDDDAVDDDASGDDDDGAGDDDSTGADDDDGGDDDSAGGGGDDDDDGPDCDPPNTIPVGEDCVPSCGYAGGDTCVAAGSTACDNLPLLASYDCALCCDRSVYPLPGPASFHVIDGADTYAWDSILALSDADLGPLIAAQNQPTGLPSLHWTQNIHTSWYADGETMADAIHGGLQAVGTAPIRVMVDELSSGTIDMIEDCADRMRTVYPQWAGRWGAYLVNGSGVAYPNLNPAIDALLDADAAIAAEMYVHQSSYCSAGSGAYDRDVWLGEFFAGTSTQGRFGWLVARRTSRSSNSHLSAMFGVTDDYLNGTSPSVFLDRMFYVWATRSGYRSFMLLANGGIGAWKWDQPAMSNTSRDQAFHESFLHYSVSGATSSRLGQVTCP